MLIVWFFVLCLTFVLLLLLILFKVEFSLRSIENQVEYSISISLLKSFIAVSYGKNSNGYLRIKVGSISVLNMQVKKKSPRERISSKQNKPEQKTKWFSYIKEIRRSNFSQLKKFVKSLRKPKLTGDIEYGLNDPYQTAIIFGIYQAILMLLNEIPIQLHLRPVFNWTGVRGEVSFSAQFVPAVLLYRAYPMVRTFRKTRV